jgi:two-component system, OmpR family, alkaline phosphatase synthesis response regulator PhoP
MDKPVVVLADDEAHITCVVAEKLRAAGFAVTAARDGEEALELILRLRPVLVITDLQMPRMNGLDLALKLAQTESTSGTPLIMLTARGCILDQAIVGKTNIRHVIGKPFSAREVVRRATELVGVPGASGDARTEAA